MAAPATPSYFSIEDRHRPEGASMILGRPQLDLNEATLQPQVLAASRQSFMSHHSKTHQVVEMFELNSSSSDSSSSDEDDDSYKSDSDRDLNIIANKNQLTTNREAFGTWNRPLDFTLTCIGYVIGIHNFFRFPHLCYKYGTWSFMVPYCIVLALVGVPLVFMECTIGQYYGVGSVTAFLQLAPIINGVSYVLAWNSFVNCWMYGAVLTWIRAYSGDSLSCLKGWVDCHEEHYFNTPYCYTGILDECCDNENPNEEELRKCPPHTYNDTNTRMHRIDGKKIDMMHFDFQCIEIHKFCKYFNWTYIGDKQCKDLANNKTISIYKRRFHAVEEYLYGYVLGMRKKMVSKRQSFIKTECNKKNDPLLVCNSSIFRRESETMEELRKQSIVNSDLLAKYWDEEGQKLEVDPESSSYLQLPKFAFTTFLFVTFFLYNHLLNVSAMTYFLNGFPFVILLYLMIKTLTFENSEYGLIEFMKFRGFQDSFTDKTIAIDIWTEAVVQVLITTGVGNGALISLASFNKYHHGYLFDVGFVILLNIMTSLIATLISFISIGSYIKKYDINVPFAEFITSHGYYSAMEFGFFANSYFLTLIDDLEVVTLLYFFMISSFPTDTIIRLAQNLLDAAVLILSRLKHHSTMALLAVTTFGWITLLPMTRNGGVALFMEYEYFALRFVIPIVTLIEVVSVAWVYRASRLMEDANHLTVVTNNLFRGFFIICMKYISPAFLILTLLSNALFHFPERFRSIKSKNTQTFTVLFGWLFCLTPIFLFVISILKQIAATPKSERPELFKPVMTKRARHLTERSIKNSIIQKPLIGITKEHTPKDNRSTENINEIRNRKNSTDFETLFTKEPMKQNENERVASPLQKDVETKGSVSFAGLGGGGTKDKSGVDPEDTLESLGSSVLKSWKWFMFWNELFAYYEDWPDRLGDSDVESEGSTEDSSEDQVEANLRASQHDSLRRSTSQRSVKSGFS